VASSSDVFLKKTFLSETIFCCYKTFLGSFLEFLPVLTLMSNGHTSATLPYHLIVPSLPGYAFSSGAPLDKDFRLEDIARILNRLVVGLGFEQGYVVQGGDIGSKIARVMAAEHPHCKGK
jgi:microsomal epoxide hydrolase